MKTYNNRKELSKDIKFLKKTLLDLETTSRYVDELFHQWKNTSPDSPWYENRGLMDNKEKIRLAINQIAVNNCDGSANEESIKAIIYLQEVSQALTIPDVSGLFEFSKFLNDNFEYFDNIEVGDVYKCKLGTGLYSEKEVYEKYLSSK